MSQPLWFPLYAKDWLASTCDLSAEARGAYVTLLAYAWDKGAIPMSDEARRCIAGLSRGASWRRVWAELEPRWTMTDAGLVNARMERERAIACDIMASKSLGGRRSAEARKAKTGSAQPGRRSEQSSEQSSEQVPEQPPIQSQSQSPTDQQKPPAAASVGEPPPLTHAQARLACLEAVGLWNAAMPPAPVAPARLTGNDYTRLRGALSTRSLSDLAALFARVAKSAYLTGRDGKHPPVSLWRALEWASRIEGGEFDDRVRVAGLRGGGAPVVARPPTAALVFDEGINYRFSCGHGPTCTTWAECRDKLNREAAS